MGPIEEVSGYWANLNHPSIEVEDTAVAILRFRSGGLGSIVTSLAQKPGIYTKVHIHGSNGASVGVETDRGATFIAGVSGIAEPPLNDLWTIPGEESLLAGWQNEDRERFGRIDPVTHYHALQDRDFLQSVLEGPQAVDDRPRWTHRGGDVYGDLPVESGATADSTRGIRGATRIRGTISGGHVVEAEQHWYEAHGVGWRKMKVKRTLD